MFQYNKRWETEVTAYNDEDPTELEGGIILREKTDDITLKILLIKEASMFFYEKDGRFFSDGLIFQVSKKELEDKSFEIITGSTFIVKGSNTYRIVEQKDYREFKFTKLIQCKALKIVDVD